MTKLFWPLAISSWGPRERAIAHAVIDGEQQTMGSHVRVFEDAFAAHVGSRHAVMTNSGSSANLIAVAVIASKRSNMPYHGYEVIAPAIAWSTTYAPFAQHGYRLVVCDVDPLTLNIDLAQVLRRAHTDRTRIVVGCSVLGNPAPLQELSDYAAGNGLWMFEDNCESLGAKIGNKHCGTFGNLGTFSFFFSHHLNTVEGGMLVTDDRELYELALCLRAHGWTRDLPTDSLLRPQVLGEVDGLDAAYQFILPGYNLRPTELAAAVGIVQLGRLPEFEDARRANSLEFQILFADDERWTTQHFTEHAVPFGFTLVFRTPAARWAASAEMAEAGIEHRLITGGSFARHPAAARYDWRYANTAKGTPNADHAHDCGLFVGNHAVDLTEQIRTLHKLLDKVIR